MGTIIFLSQGSILVYYIPMFCEWSFHTCISLWLCLCVCVWVCHKCRKEWACRSCSSPPTLPHVVLLHFIFLTISVCVEGWAPQCNLFPLLWDFFELDSHTFDSNSQKVQKTAIVLRLEVLVLFHVTLHCTINPVHVRSLIFL